MTRWVAFAALTLLVASFVLLSARASERLVAEFAAEPGPDEPSLPDGADHLDVTGTVERPDATSGANRPAGTGGYRGGVSGPKPSSMALLANVGVSHALFAALLIVGIQLTDVPVASLGIGAGVTGPEAAGLGIVVGLAIALVNTLLSWYADSDPSAELRALLTPSSPSGWVVLLLVVLPIIAGFEELLFRAAMIGAFSTGFGVSPWLLAVASSLVFAAGHGAQGRLGVVATGVLGFALAAVFVVTESLLVVFLAHYVVNAVEFGLEGLGYEPFGKPSGS